MSEAKVGIVLINIGSPDSYKTADVRKYLKRFLNDPRVIDLPYLLRKILVNGIIVPFRAPKSALSYKKIWTDNGSPLIVYSKSVEEKLQLVLGQKYLVKAAMLYGNPMLKNVLTEMNKTNLESLILVPMYPQYASSSTGSALENALKTIKNWEGIPSIKTISPFYNSPYFLDTVVARAKLIDFSNYDYVLFSYHGLPIRHIKNSHRNHPVCDNSDQCLSEGLDKTPLCYKGSCYKTTQLLISRLNIPKTIPYSTSFQSRLNKEWLEPFTDKTLIHLAEKGIKKMVVFCPSFVADCLETIYEIQVEYNTLFKKHGGQEILLVPSLNDSDDWIEALKNIIL